LAANDTYRIHLAAQAPERGSELMHPSGFLLALILRKQLTLGGGRR
jgi:hypothetical protein